MKRIAAFLGLWLAACGAPETPPPSGSGDDVVSPVTIRVRSTDPDGRPVPGAVIFDDYYKIRATTDADGRVTIEQRGHPGYGTDSEYRLSASKYGYSREEITIHPGRDEEVEWDVPLRPLPVLTTLDIVPEGEAPCDDCWLFVTHRRETLRFPLIAGPVKLPVHATEDDHRFGFRCSRHRSRPEEWSIQYRSGRKRYVEEIILRLEKR